MKRLLVLLLIILLLPSITLAQVKQIGTIPLKVSSIESVTPYDHGLIVVLSYTNSTLKNHAIFYIYFLNSSTELLLYKFTLNVVASAFSFVEGGELYVIVITANYLTRSFVFKGLRLIKDYTVNGIMAYERNIGEPLHNLSALVIEKKSYVILMLNNTNITFFNQCPIITLKLPNGILTVSVNSSSIFMFEKPHAVPFNFTLFSYDGKIIWSKSYCIYNIFSTSLPNLPVTHMFPEYFPTAYLLLDEDFATIVNNQLFILNATPVSFLEINHPINATVLGINLEDGKLMNEIKLTNVTLKTALLNIGGMLYVTVLNNDEVIVERYNGSGLSLVVKIPLKVRELKQSVIENKVPLTGFFYDFSKYLLIVNPGLTGANVTDIYSGRITHYLINENASTYYLSNDVILLNESDNFSLAFLNNNGTLKGIVSLSEISPTDKSIYFAEVNPYKYYMVVYSNDVIVYEVTSQKFIPVTSSSSVYPIDIGILLVVAVIIVVAVLVLIKRKRR
ncbi:hypothetical protein EWF20_00750 [Sulfolobus sp. S-194]|uniref:hypothetical protein n=1 Tax=Sulfolobus sp. S-194 TaxID=2512240 RepID=UPI001436E0B6|nr:hypothetical protein [Sulfolobus sp. S-194]QIW22834.1 hypothetical protein EWF20_00750 [Sulfolobus sp. S-194]